VISIGEISSGINKVDCVSSDEEEQHAKNRTLNLQRTLIIGFVFNTSPHMDKPCQLNLLPDQVLSSICHSHMPDRQGLPIHHLSHSNFFTEAFSSVTFSPGVPKRRA